MDFKLRKCTMNDLDFIIHLKELGMKWYIEKIYGWDYEVQKEKTLNELNKNLNNMNIIVVDGKDVGVTTFCENCDFYEIGLIVIHPNFQNKGIASQILKEYISIAQTNKKRIIIKTFKENPAQKLYLRLGFEICSIDSTHIHFEINFK